VRNLPDPVPARAAGGWPRGAVVRAGSMVRRTVLPRSVPVHRFGRLERKAIHDGTGQATISGAGTATVRVGPQHWGETWYPASADIATTSGINDASSCQFYLGVISAATQIGGQSYAGGGDTMSWSARPVQFGEQVFAVWSGGNPGDIATMRVTGDADVII
jgi:hypothetical protein